jgi:ABC-2 type transport system ATP-binding protein
LSTTSSPLAYAAPRPSGAAGGGEVRVVLQGVSVRYRLPSERITSLKEYAIRRLTGRKVQYSEFWALRDIHLEVRQGQALALIGRNGAGKSTLLKVIARVLRPTTGRVWVKGTISPLIELGAGFHPDLTGRENVFVNGAMLGFSRAYMQRRFESIVAFSGLEHFIDSPLRTYSSGMQARLGFAILADTEPDVLIVDEALAVGDEAFRKKCIARMHAFREQGATIFYVTHALEGVPALCPEALWLEGGRIRFGGPTQEVIALYRQSVETAASLSETQKLQIVRVERGSRSKRLSP